MWTAVQRMTSRCAPTHRHARPERCKIKLFPYRKVRMNKSDPPRSFGVFKPEGHTVIAFPSSDLVLAAINALLVQGFQHAAMVRYTPQEMKAQVKADLSTASPLASLGQEVNLVKAHLALAQLDCSFLIVHAPTKEQAAQVAKVAREMGAQAAQQYGRFLVEELIDQPVGTRQVFESPERGLDLKIPPAPLS